MVNINEKIELIKRKLKLKKPNAEFEVAITPYNKLYQIKIWEKSSDFFRKTKKLIADRSLSKDEFLNLNEKGIDEFIQNIFTDKNMLNDRPKPGPESR